MPKVNWPTQETLAEWKCGAAAAAAAAALAAPAAAAAARRGGYREQQDSSTQQLQPTDTHALTQLLYMPGA